MNLEAYFERIGYQGERSVGRECLDAILVAHMRAIPFENIDVILGRAIALDPDSLEEKLVARKRGGYCYEHGLLFAGALRALGSDVDILGARVRLRSAPDDPPTPRTHVAVRVAVDGRPHLLDPGFGGPGPQFAMPLEKGAEVEGPGGRFRFADAPMDQWALQRRTGDAWVDVYHLGLDPMPLIDVEMANHFTATHPSSPFTQMLWARTVEPDGSRSVMGRELAVNDASGRNERTLGSRQELRDALRDELGLDVPEVATSPIPGFD